MHRKLVSLIAPSVVALSMLAACAPPGSAPAPSPVVPTAPAAKPGASPAATAPAATPKPAAEAPRSGGVLTRAMGRDAASFDVQREQGADASVTLFNIYEGLVRLDPVEHKSIRPELAES